MPSEPDPERDAPTHTRRASFDGPPPPKLVKFRVLTGIHTPTIITGDRRSRPAPNVGIYSRIVAEETTTRWQYYIMASVINLSFLSQIVVAATLTALGAADASHIAITILGSLNTVIAGVQTYLKGQGLPNRLKQYEFGLRKLREHIEDLERAFSHADCRMNVDDEISDVGAMYKAVRQTAEDNTPDTYLPMAGAGQKLLGDKFNKVTGQEDSGLGTGLLMHGPSDSSADADPSKFAAAADAIEQANGLKSPAEPETPGQLKGETPETAAFSAEGPAAKGQAPSTTPNEDGETEEAPLLQHDSSASASKS